MKQMTRLNIHCTSFEFAYSFLYYMSYPFQTTKPMCDFYNYIARARKGVWILTAISAIHNSVLCTWTLKWIYGNSPPKHPSQYLHSSCYCAFPIIFLYGLWICRVCAYIIYVFLYLNFLKIVIYIYLKVNYLSIWCQILP